MFKKIKGAGSQKRKQLSLLDFLSAPYKKNCKQNQTVQNSEKATNQNRKVDQSSCCSAEFSQENLVNGDNQSCSITLFESLESVSDIPLNASESTPLMMEDIKSIDEKIMFDEEIDHSLIQENDNEEVSSMNRIEDDENLQLNTSLQQKVRLQEKNSFNTQGNKEETHMFCCSSGVSSSFGCPFEQLSRRPQCSSSLPLLNQTFSHTVLFDPTSGGSGAPPPFKSPYKDAWNASHVRLPCSPNNLYPVKNMYGSSVENRWELVESSLLNPMSSSIDLEEAILTYNSRYSNQWSFRGLHKLFTEDVDPTYRSNFFSTTLPKMVRLALMLPKLFPEPIPLLSRQKDHTVTMTQQQVACLLCNAFFCTFPWRNSKKSTSEYFNYPDINFNRLFTSSSPNNSVVSEKLKMLIHYFERTATNMPCGTISFERRCLKEFPRWEESPCTLGAFHARSHGMIEKEGFGMLQVDFANRFIGGGVLGFGAVQEEIRFCVCPELIVTRLFCEALENNECIIVTGAEQYSDYSGYRDSLKFVGNHDDVTPRDKWRRRQTEIVAIDAICFSKPSNQYKPSNIRRELNKAFCGFLPNANQDQYPAVATGNWGCGAFNGNPMLKGLIQMMASAASGRDLCYFTFEDVDLAEKLHNMYSFVKDKQLKLSDLWKILMRYHVEVILSSAEEDLFEFIQRTCREYDESTDESDA